MRLALLTVGLSLLSVVRAQEEDDVVVPAHPKKVRAGEAGSGTRV